MNGTYRQPENIMIQAMDISPVRRHKNGLLQANPEVNGPSEVLGKNIISYRSSANWKPLENNHSTVLQQAAKDL